MLGGVNDGEARSEDRIVSAGSASTTALALALRVLTDDRPHRPRDDDQRFMPTRATKACRTMPLQRLSPQSFRRTQHHPERHAGASLGGMRLAAVRGKLSGFALNVPVGKARCSTSRWRIGRMRRVQMSSNGLFAAAAAADPRRFAVRARAPFPTHKHFVPRGMGQCPTLARRSAPCPSAMAFGRRAARWRARWYRAAGVVRRLREPAPAPLRNASQGSTATDSRRPVRDRRPTQASPTPTCAETASRSATAMCEIPLSRVIHCAWSCGRIVCVSDNGITCRTTCHAGRSSSARRFGLNDLFSGFVIRGDIAIASHPPRHATAS